MRLAMIIGAFLLSTLASAQGRDSDFDMIPMTRRGVVDGVGTLVHSIQHFQVTAKDVSRMFRSQGNARLQGKYRALSDRAIGLSARVRFEVEMPAINKVPLKVVRQNFSNVLREIDRLEMDSRDVGEAGFEFADRRETMTMIKLMLVDAFQQNLQEGMLSRETMCTAFDKGAEEHPGGHIGIAPSQADAQEMANALCNEFHGQCRIINCRAVF